MQGRKPKPVSVQIAAGDPRKIGKQKLAAQLATEVKATRGLPACPDHIVCSRPVISEAPRPRRRGLYWCSPALVTPCGACIPCRARATWESWAEELEVMDLDHRPDAQMLEGACMAYAQAVEADLTIARQGSVCSQETLDPQTKEKMVKLKAHPAVAISRAAWVQVKALCSEFGLSPVSRQRLSIEKKDEVESGDLMSILSQPRAPRPAPLFDSLVN